jgi:hypothetical protein
MGFTGRLLRPIRDRPAVVLVVLVVLVVVVLGLAQVFLPSIAAQKVREDLARYGTVESVSVQAWPAVELLWGKADSVKVKAASLRMTPTQSVKLLWEGRHVSNMEFTAASTEESSPRLHDVSLSKHGNQLRVEASLAAADAKVALPAGVDVRLLGSEDGKVEVQVSGRLFGVGASVDAVVGAQEGKLIARPKALLLSVLRLTLFSNPHINVEGVGARGVFDSSAQPSSYRLTMTARLR